MPACNVRLLQPLQSEDGTAGPLLCVTGDGCFNLLEEQQSSGGGGGTEVAVCSSTPLPGTPAAAAAAAAPQPGVAGEQQGAAGEGEAAAPAEQQPAELGGGKPADQPAEHGGSDDCSSANGGTTAGPVYVAESGYRGHRQACCEGCSTAGVLRSATAAARSHVCILLAFRRCCPASDTCR